MERIEDEPCGRAATAREGKSWLRRSEAGRNDHIPFGRSHSPARTSHTRHGRACSLAKRRLLQAPSSARLLLTHLAVATAVAHVVSGAALSPTVAAGRGLPRGPGSLRLGAAATRAAPLWRGCGSASRLPVAPRLRGGGSDRSHGSAGPAGDAAFVGGDAVALLRRDAERGVSQRAGWGPGSEPGTVLARLGLRGARVRGGGGVLSAPLRALGLLGAPGREFDREFAAIAARMAARPGPDEWRALQARLRAAAEASIAHYRAELGRAAAKQAARNGGAPRGVFVLLEGLDRSGKSTQAARLEEELRTKGPARRVAFPRRETASGRVHAPPRARAPLRAGGAARARPPAPPPPLVLS